LERKALLSWGQISSCAVLVAFGFYLYSVINFPTWTTEKIVSHMTHCCTIRGCEVCLQCIAIYSVLSLYAMVSFVGLVPIYIPENGQLLKFLFSYGLYLIIIKHKG
jgi:hypothetical protein